VTYHKQQLDSLLVSYGLYSIIKFPTRIHRNSYCLIDNIFINTCKFTNFIVHPIINGLSDHDAQNLIIQDIFKQKRIKGHNNIRIINDDSIADFNNRLSYESWKGVINVKDVNSAFNIFLNTYLTIFHSSFPSKKIIPSLSVHMANTRN
jgi:hypothetical protein